MIDPSNITNYNLTTAELEEHLLFWVFAAGHNAKSTARGVDRFLNQMYAASGVAYSPFIAISYADIKQGWEAITDALSESGLGCWRIKSKTIQQLITADLNLKTCSVEDLESIYGIGPKTARCFILHSRRNARVAGLDTHILSCLRDLGLDVPKHPGKKYKHIESKFLELVDVSKLSVADLDLMIWNAYSKGRKEDVLSFLRPMEMADSWYN